jgi:COMPASS component SWD2
MWNLTAPECIGVLQFPEGSSAPQAAYDPCGLIFAVTACIGDANLVKLFDARSFEQGPFTTFTLTHETVATALQQKVAGMTRKVATSLSRAQWLNLKFSPNGANILVSTDVGVVIILDAYDCK